MPRLAPFASSITQRKALLNGASGAALATMLVIAPPAHAQLRNMAAALGHPVSIATPNVQSIGSRSVISPSMAQIQQRQAAYRARISQQANIISSANAAARAAAQAAAQTVPNGMTQGGLVPVANATTSSLDASGLKVWQGASAPTQTTNGNFVDVTINQTQSRALLSWESFNVGRDTTLTFNQQGHSDWVVVNRVVGGINPATGLLDPKLAPSPSQILGSIKADGTVYVLNRSGVLFGATSQVNLHSLVASTLELGASTIPTGSTVTPTRTLSLAERNDAYLQNGILSASRSGLLGSVTGETHGAVTVAQGAQINSTGGFVILAAPTVSSAGEIKTAAGGQASLEAGNQIDAYSSTGAAGSIDPNVRGLVLTSVGGGTVDVSGSIDAPQGYISLGTDQTGAIDFSGVLTSTTSVSRNGKISLTGGTVNARPNAAISILPDSSSATIPISPNSVAAFKTSQIDIGSHFYRLVEGKIVGNSGEADTVNDLLPSSISIGTNATIQAPSADVNIGGTAKGRSYAQEEGLITTSKVDIASGAVIDVSGITDWLLTASRNQLVIDPAKRNELRDTPTYREATTDGSFTLNGQTLYVDPRISGVRSDGVAWIGSPLLEAGSLAEQIGVTASELMTKGGNVTLSTLTNLSQPVSRSSISGVNIAKDATVDFAGGWVRYQDGFIRTSKLITKDGRVVDISAANPNDTYVAVANGFVENLPQLSNPRVYANIFSNDSHFEAGYVEGHDAGSLTIKAPSVHIDPGAQLHGEAVAGLHQIADAQAASAASRVAGDIRKLQARGTELPSSGLLHIQSVLGGDIQVGGARRADPETNYLSASLINRTHLSGLSLQTSGKVTFAGNSTGLTDGEITLADGGALNIDSGRSITFNGTVSAAGGTIMARTYGDRFGSIFTNADDLPLDNIATATTLPGMFDITVNPNAVLSTRGRWVNDSLVTDGNYLGGAYTSGGSITLNAAPHIALFTDATQSKAVDLSGSIEIKGNSLIDVSGGGYVSSTGALSLNGKGGNVSLIDETVYFQLQQTDVTNTGSLGGQDLFRSDISAFNVSPVAGTGFGSALIPDTINAHVSIADGTIRGFGFKGGGTFKLVTPDLAFGSSGGAGTAIPLDFLQKTGFGTLDLTAWNTALIDNVFSNGRVGKTAIASTEQLKINAGETLNLTQSILPSILTQAQINTVRGLATGTDISREASLAPTNALGDYDNLAAHLKLGGLTELDVLGGGKIIGAPGASITAPKLYNDGTIEISGGTITQSQTLPFIYTGRPAIGVHRVLSGGADLGAGFSAVFGPADSAGKFDELANNALGISAAGNILTNRELVAGYQTDRALYYLGQLDTDQGILFTANSVTNLSGTTILNPRAPLLANGRRIATGRIIDGGTIEALGQQTSETELFSLSDFAAVSYRVGSSTGAYKPKGSRDAFRIDAEAGALIDLSGANGMFDLQTTSAAFTPTQVASNGGLLSALGGGNISGAIVHANGGNRQALGGTIEWLNPVLTQANAKGAIDTLSADQIMSAGFSSFVARGALDTQGAVDLSLGRSFLLMSPDFLGKSAPDAYYQISIASHGDLSIKAPHIGLLSSAPTVGSVPGLLTQAGGSDQLLLQADSIDIAGGVALGASIDHATLDAAGDIRLIGVAPVDRTFVPGSTAAPSLTGGLVVAGDLTLRAAQVYATTGTGNLQQLLEAPTAKPSPFVIASLGGLSLSGLTVGKPGATIRIESNGAPTPSAPLSAGSYLSIVAPNIEQAGVLRAPLGRIDLGSRGGLIVNVGSTPAIVTTNNLTLEDGSVTSVSAKGLTIPYGTTTDLTEYYFSPSVTSPLTREPAAQLSLGGNSIVAGNNATVDLSGGGDLYAYEFVSGTGGSRDVLNRFNSDAFSSTNGYQYTDGRQVYAIVPAASAASVALFDPIYSGDYGALYGSDVGKTVHLDAAPGMPAGEYVLMPAKYALLPGAMRLVENVGSAAPILGSATTLLDGSVLVGGSYGVSGTGYVDSQRRSFTIQNQATIKSYSRIETTSGNTTFSQAGGGSALAARIANDAARLVLDPLTTLHIGASFNTAGTNGGRGSQVDILGNVLSVVSSPSGNPASSGTELAVDDLARLNADSLLIGGTRTELKDGSTDIRVTASSITVANDAAHPLSAPEIILAVDGANSQLNIADGASLVATGSLTDTRTTDYNVASYTLDSNGNPLGVNSGAGAVLRLANGPERLINRAGALAASVTSKPVGFNIGAATLSGTSLALDSSRNLTVDTLSSIGVRNLALSGDNIAFSSRTFGISGLVITPELEQSFSSINHITLRSPKVIGFTPGTHQFNNMFIDAPGLRVLNPTAGQPQQSLAVELNVAGEFKLGNSSGALSCTFSGATNCQSSGNSLVVNANTLRFGSGTFRTYNFDASVALNAASGAYYEGTGVLDVGNAALSLTTPFLVDRGTGKMPTDAKSVQADLTLLTGSSLTIAAPANTAVVAPTTHRSRPARVSHSAPLPTRFSRYRSLPRCCAPAQEPSTSRHRETSSSPAMRRFRPPSYSQKLGDAADAVTVSANGGTVALLSKTGGIDLGASTAINIGGTSGKAGSVRLIAAEGLVTMAGAINAAAPDAGASFTLDNGLGRFDFSAFANNFGKQFTGNIAIRTGAGDLALNAGQKLKIASLDLTADGGFVRIDGTLDTSGTNGGDIALYARDGVSLGSTSLLDSHSSGYADTDTRQASAGDITLGVGASGSIAVAQGAVLDLGTRRLGDRLVAREQTDPHHAQPDNRLYLHRG
jgi:filamentous hemagglutinin family protein